MTDPITALVRAAEAAAHDPGLAPDPVAAVRARVDRRRTRRRLRVGAAAAAVALIAGTAVLVAGRAGDAEPEGVATTPTPSAPRADDGDVPPSPLSPRRQVAMAPAGDEVVVWGGVSGTVDLPSDGAAYDRTTGEWRLLSPSPLAERDPGGMPPVAAPTEDEDVVVARDRAVARWDAATDTWTELDDAPATVTDLTDVGDGRIASFSARAVLDVATGRWEQPGSGPPHELGATATAAAAVTWTGEELFAVGASPDGPDARPYALALDPLTLTWREVAPPPQGTIGAFGVTAAWDGERVVVSDYAMAAVAYDPATDGWEALPRVPARFAEHHPSSASVGGVTVASTARTLAVLDAVRQIWTPFPNPNPNDGGGPPGRWLVPVDDTTIAVWVDDAGPNDADLVLFDPTTLAGRDRRRQVGVASVVMAGDEYVQGGFPTEDGAVVVDLLTAAGEHCRVTSGLGLPLGSEEQRAVREVVPIDDPSSRRTELIWFHDEAGGRWEAEVEDTDLLVVDCDDGGAARRLVGSVSLT